MIDKLNADKLTWLKDLGEWIKSFRSKKLKEDVRRKEFIKQHMAAHVCISVGRICL